MEKIDLFERALAINGGAPVPVILLGVDLSLRRDFTGQEAHDIVRALFDHADEAVHDQATRVVALVSDSPKKDQEAFVDQLMTLSLAEVMRVFDVIGEICGYRDADGNFFPTSSS